MNKETEQHQGGKEHCSVTWLMPHPSVQLILRNSKLLLQRGEMFESEIFQCQDDLQEYLVTIQCSVSLSTWSFGNEARWTGEMVPWVKCLLNKRGDLSAGPLVKSQVCWLGPVTPALQGRGSSRWIL